MAALKLILASVKRAFASSNFARVSGTLARASARPATASAREAWRVPGSKLHKIWPWDIVLPFLRGSLTTWPDVSERTSTDRAAAVSPRKITALSIVFAVLLTTTTEIVFSLFFILDKATLASVFNSGPSPRSPANSSIFLPLEKPF